MANTEIDKEIIPELSFSKEALKELERARKMPVTFDVDCPETTPERAKRFRRVNPSRQTLKAQ